MVRAMKLAMHMGYWGGAPIDVMQLNQGFFDEAHISIISTATIRGIEQEAGLKLDVRRFRPGY